MKIPATLAPLLPPSRPIYALSPHIDDAIWSAGGFLQELSKQGYEVFLVSIFSHSIYVYDDIRPPIEATHIRKGEDYNAARLAGFKQVIFLDFPDGILRDTPQTSVINSSYQTPTYLLQMVSDCLRQVIPSQATLLMPAGFGDHMDHITTRRAGMLLKQPKILYEDLPYATRAQGKEEAQNFLKDWQNIRVPMPPSMLKNHLELFWQYPSQASEPVADEISTYLAERGLGLWIP